MKPEVILILSIIVLLAGGIALCVYALRSLKQEVHDTMYRYAWQATKRDSTAIDYVTKEMKPILYLGILAGVCVGAGVVMAANQVLTSFFRL